MNPLIEVRDALWQYAIARQAIVDNVPLAYREDPKTQEERPHKTYGDSAILNLFFSGGGGSKRMSSSSQLVVQNFTWSMQALGTGADDAYALVKVELVAAMLTAAEAIKQTFKYVQSVEMLDTVDNDEPERRRPGWFGVLAVSVTMRFSDAQLKAGFVEEQ